MIHVPVLLNEVIEYLNPKPNKNYIDCTLGEGRHAKAILEKTGSKGKLLGIDLNAKSLNLAKTNLSKFNKERIILVCSNFANLKQIVYEYKFNRIFGILFDLGVSSFLLEHAGQGFSFQKEEPLDMRYSEKFPISNFPPYGWSPKGGQFPKKLQITNYKQIPNLTARKIVNEYSEEKLVRILQEYGEEKYARNIARKICQERKQKPIKTTFDLVEIIRKVAPKNYEKGRLHPATRTFQAVRIEVNQELENLKKVLPQALEILEQGGRLVVISYHSLEDRIVKRFFVQEAKDCLCPRDFPECRCGHKRQLKIIAKKPIVPSINEIKGNPRARSAKMRVAEKL